MLIMSLNELSPEKYEAQAKYFSRAAMEAQNEASYNFEGADPELDSTWAHMYARLAEVIRERQAVVDKGTEASSRSENSEASPTELIDVITGLVAGSPPESTTKSESMFRQTREEAHTATKKTSHYELKVSAVTEETRFLGMRTSEGCKLQVMEFDGAAEGHYRRYLTSFEPYALVETVFEIEPTTRELTVTQEHSNAVTAEHRVVFPSFGIDKASSDEQWSRLAVILDEFQTKS
jgi:hypothetical protein